MALVSKEAAIGLIKTDGQYKGDPQVLNIWRYWNYWTEDEGYAIGYTSQDTPYGVDDVILLWSKEGGITQAGKELLEEGGS